jgi:fukutin-related protein
MKRKELKQEQFRKMYQKLSIKKVVKKFNLIALKSSQKSVKKNKNLKLGGQKLHKESKNGEDVLIEPLEMTSTFTNSSGSKYQLATDVSFYGCDGRSKSCLGQVLDNKPFYLYMNRNLPPCCQEKLKSVFKYVVEELENSGVRYWLDNSALKNALELNDLSPIAFEIDISFNINDYNRSTAMKRCFDSRPYSDLAGFYWIKATDGHYLKVQFSKTNEIHVNLLPYEIRNDHVIPKGFYGRKAKEFSLEFLHPMSNIFFLGRNVFVPNNAPSYLANKGYNMNF